MTKMRVRFICKVSKLSVFLACCAGLLATGFAEQVPVPSVPATSFDAPEGAWTLVVLPDTQHMVDGQPEAFRRQAEWIAANKDGHHIVFVAHEGDVTNNNSPEQWRIVRRTMDVLKNAHVPYALTTGNKDLGDKGGGTDRMTRLNDFFSPADYDKSTVLFEPGHVENSIHELDTPWGPFLLLSLELGPRDEVLEWANRVVAEHPDHRVIVVTHACVNKEGRLFGPGGGGNLKSYLVAKDGNFNDGEDLWNKLLSKHPNISLVLCGHSGGTGVARLEKTGEAGNPVHLMLANFQRPIREDGGGGYLRLLRFLPDGKTVEVKTYSPWYDDWLKTPEHDFRLTLPGKGEGSKQTH